MIRQFLTLAGLAVAAVPEVEITGAAAWGYQDTNDYDSALLQTRAHGTLLIRRAASPAAAQELRAREVALAALTPGMRARLPFAVPTTLAAGVRAEPPFAVTEFIPGVPADRVEFDFDSALVAQLGHAIAAIHGLPTQPLVSGGLAETAAAEQRERTANLIDRADATGRLPQPLVDRWGAAVDDPQLWEFTPCVVHGSLERASFLVEKTAVTGVLGWSDLRIGDPASDIRWVQTLDGAVQRALLDEYVEARGTSVDRQLRTRALLYAELELARWLLLGVERRDEAVLADAEQLLDGLVTRVRSLDEAELKHETLPVLDVAEVQQLLADAGERARTLQHRSDRPADEPPEVLDDEIDEDGSAGNTAE